MTASLVDRGYAMLNRVMQPAAGLTVRYIRDGIVLSDELKATVKASLISIVTEGGSSVVGREFVFSLYRPDFVLEGVPTKPMRGDVIEWYLHGVVQVFHVLPETGGIETRNVDRRSDWIPANVKLVEQRSE